MESFSTFELFIKHFHNLENILKIFDDDILLKKKIKKKNKKKI